jgi:hypothetical protein
MRNACQVAGEAKKTAENPKHEPLKTDDIQKM